MSSNAAANASDVNNLDPERCVTPVNQMIPDPFDRPAEALWAPARPRRIHIVNVNNNNSGGDESVGTADAPWAPQRPGPRARLPDLLQENNPLRPVALFAERQT